MEESLAYLNNKRARDIHEAAVPESSYVTTQGNVLVTMLNTLDKAFDMIDGAELLLTEDYSEA